MKVLAYHKIVNSENFDQQIKYLSKRYSFSDYYQDKEKSVMITSDDGDLSFYLNAFPILKKHRIPAVLFVITDLINTNKPFWWDEIEYYLGKEEGNKKVWEVKNWSNKKREDFLQNLRKRSDKPELTKEQLTTDQLREMQDAGIIIANHSHTHPLFDQCTPDELEKEMEHSTRILKEFGFSPEIFAYPNGNSSLQSETILKKYEINEAYLFDHKIGKTKSHPFRISRLIVNDTTPMWKFKLILSGWHSKILPLTKGLAKLKKRL